MAKIKDVKILYFKRNRGIEFDELARRLEESMLALIKQGYIPEGNIIHVAETDATFGGFAHKMVLYEEEKERMAPQDDVNPALLEQIELI